MVLYLLQLAICSTTCQLWPWVNNYFILYKLQCNSQLGEFMYLSTWSPAGSVVWESHWGNMLKVKYPNYTSCSLSFSCLLIQCIYLFYLFTLHFTHCLHSVTSCHNPFPLLLPFSFEQMQKFLGIPPSWHFKSERLGAYSPTEAREGSPVRSTYPTYRQ